jgi:UDP-N-acetylglucosamine 2-epimerase (non-hydrolysing)
MNRLKTLAVLGTRPEAIKMVPVLRRLRNHEKIELVVVATSQHREMLDQVLRLFGVVPDVDLDIMQPRQSLNDIVRRSVEGLDRVLHEYAPDVLLVQGDTTTAFTAALAAFHRRIQVGHIEAGLRSYDPNNPYPEEVNRRLISGVASIHFAPTEQSAENLLREGISPERIYRTGNTIVDCLLEIVGARPNSLADYLPPHFQLNGHKLILVTAHRRENWHGPMQELCEAVAELARELPDARILYPVHLNPAVRETVFPILSGLPNVALVNPLPYCTFVEAMAASYLILTDSGGVQEEAPSLGKPVLVLRETTERPEGLALGAAKLVGTDRRAIVSATLRLFRDESQYRRMVSRSNPYGDGRAAERTVQGLLHHFSMGPKPEPFVAEGIARTTAHGAGNTSEGVSD